MKESKRYIIQVDGMDYPTFKRASEEIGITQAALYLRVERFTKKGLSFSKVINGKTVSIEEIKFKYKEVLASVKIDFIDSQDKEFIERLESDMLQHSKLSEEDRKNVKFEVGYEGTDFVYGKITVKASITR